MTLFLTLSMSLFTVSKVCVLFIHHPQRLFYSIEHLYLSQQERSHMGGLGKPRALSNIFELRQMHLQCKISLNFFVWKLCGSTQCLLSIGRIAKNSEETFPQNFHNRKLGEISAFYATIYTLKIKWTTRNFECSSW